MVSKMPRHVGVAFVIGRLLGCYDRLTYNYTT